LRILIYSLNHAPELTGIGKYNGEMASWLAQRGHQVRVVCAPPYYPHWRVQPGWSAWRYRRESIAGVWVQRCPLWVPATPTGLKRIVHLLSFALSSLPVILMQWRWRPQWIVVTEPPLFCVPAAQLLARLSGARLWLHVQDFEVDAARQLGLLQRPRLMAAVSALEGRLMRRCERVSTLTPSMLARLADKGVEAQRRVLFPNWIDQSMFTDPDTDIAALRRKWSLQPGEFVVLYAGNMGRKQGLETILEAAQRLSSVAAIKFWLCGEGAQQALLRQRAAGMDNVTFMRLQPEPRFRQMMSLVDLHLLPQQAGATDLVMPSKLLGIFASGRPAVVATEPGSGLYQATSGRALQVPPGDVDALQAAIVRLRADPLLAQRLARAAWQHAHTHWLRENVLRQFESQLLEPLSASRQRA